jgi:hypothetical protein
LEGADCAKVCKPTNAQNKDKSICNLFICVLGFKKVILFSKKKQILLLQAVTKEFSF